MHTLKHSNGTVFSFAFDPITKMPAPEFCFWSDTDGVTWEEVGTKLAGNARHRYFWDVSRVYEGIDGNVYALTNGGLIYVLINLGSLSAGVWGLSVHDAARYTLPRAA